MSLRSCELNNNFNEVAGCLNARLNRAFARPASISLSLSHSFFLSPLSGRVRWKNDTLVSPRKKFRMNVRSIVALFGAQGAHAFLIIGRVLRAPFITHANCIRSFICFRVIACSLPRDPAIWRNATVHRGQSRPGRQAGLSSPREERAVHLAEGSKGMLLVSRCANF